MPTLVADLTPLQRMWLYENQLTRGDSRDSYEDRWTRMGTTYSDDIFRARPEPPPPQHPMRKRKYDDESCIQISPRDCARSPSSPPLEHRPRHQAHNKGPQFPYQGDKLSWQQSLDNLKVYRDHYGVRETIDLTKAVNDPSSNHFFIALHPAELQRTAEVLLESKAWALDQQAKKEEKEPEQIWGTDNRAGGATRGPRISVESVDLIGCVS